MASPTVTATLTPATVAPGGVLTLTVTHADTDRAALAVSITVTDSTGATGTTTANAVIDQGAVTVTSSPARAWTLVSSTLNQSVFTAIA